MYHMSIGLLYQPIAKETQKAPSGSPRTPPSQLSVQIEWAPRMLSQLFARDQTAVTLFSIQASSKLLSSSCLGC